MQPDLELEMKDLVVEADPRIPAHEIVVDAIIKAFECDLEKTFKITIPSRFTSRSPPN